MRRLPPRRPTRRRSPRPVGLRRGSPRGGLSGGLGRDPRGGHSHIVLATAGLALYFATLWFGVTVIGDNAVRSAIMAGIIVAIAACGYVFTRQPAPRDE
jgi:hypothetical protein